jgi:hypothetical protein
VHMKCQLMTARAQWRASARRAAVGRGQGST